MSAQGSRLHEGVFLFPVGITEGLFPANCDYLIDGRQVLRISNLLAMDKIRYED